MLPESVSRSRIWVAGNREYCGESSYPGFRSVSTPTSRSENPWSPMKDGLATNAKGLVCRRFRDSGSGIEIPGVTVDESDRRRVDLNASSRGR